MTLPPGTLTEVPFRHLVEEPLATLRRVYADQGLVSDAPSSAQEESVRHHEGEIEMFIIRQPPKGEKDDYDSENSWISDGLPSSSRRRRRGDGR